MTDAEKMAERRFEAIAAVWLDFELDRSGYKSGSNEHYAFCEEATGLALLIVAADPATALLAEAAQVLRELQHELVCWSLQECGEGYNNTRLNALLARIDSSGGAG